MSAKINIDYRLLSKLCTHSTDSILKNPDYGVYDDIGEFSYKNIGAKILLVAHVDTVFPDRADFTSYNPTGEKLMLSPNLDDRLGVYTLIDILPKLGVKFDMLLTNHEETAYSTANEFNAMYGDSKRYNWIASFDRHGINPVLYQFDTPELRGILRSVNIVPDYGSFSDIVELTAFKVAAINFGIGYHNEHTALCYAPVRDYITCVNRFIQFYNRYKDTKIKHVAKPKINRVTKWSGKNEVVRGELVHTGTTVASEYDTWERDRCEDCGYIGSDVVYYHPPYDIYLCDICARNYDNILDSDNRKGGDTTGIKLG